MSKNPKLKNAPIKEALLEIRFKPKNDYSRVVGALYESLKDTYPVFEDLGIPDFPNAPATGFMDEVVRHRCRTKDNNRLYNLGKSIISVNVLDYIDFEAFQNDIKAVLSEHKKKSNVTDITRLTLRYINVISPKTNNVNPKKIFTIGLQLPKNLEDNMKGFSCSSKGQINEDIITVTLRTHKPFEKQEYILDINYYREAPMQYNLKKIDTWVKNAHDKIYETFKSSFTKEYFDLLINGK